MIKLSKIYGKKRVLVTGGLGFIGSNLAHRLVEYGAEVVLVDSLIPEYGGNIFNISSIKDKVQVNISDIRDRYSMDHLVQGKDYIFNLAGTLSHIDSMKDPFTDLEINCRSQLSILESCREHNPNVKIVFAGTRGQYGKAQYLPVDEKHPINPTDVNGINNMAAELYHLLYANIYSIKAVSLRLANTFGPRHQMRHSRQGVLNWFIRQLIEGTKIKLYGDGKQVRDTNYIDDVVDALLIAMANDAVNGGAYNLGGVPVSLVDFIDKAIKIYKKGSYELMPFPNENKAIEIGDYIADYSKFSQATGWKPKITLDEGIKNTLEYYIKHREFYW